MPKKKTGHTGYRDNDTGKFVPKDVGQRRPKSTTKETIPNPGHGDTDGSGHTGYRDNDTGRFVPKDVGRRRPKSTIKETIPNPGHGDTGRGGGSKKGKK